MNTSSEPGDSLEKQAGISLREARQTQLLKVFLVMSVIYTLYLAKTLFIPLVFSAFVALLLSPLVALGRKIYIPRTISAFVLIGLLIAPFSFLGVELVKPAERWMETLPKISAQITEQINEISEKFEQEQNQAEIQAEAERKQKEAEEASFFDNWFKDDEPEAKVEEVKEVKENVVTGQIKQGSIEIFLSLLASAPFLIAQMFGSVILILFLLIFGPVLFKIFIQDFPVVVDKERTVQLVGQIQKRLSNYIITISMINGLLGIATATAFYFLGVEDAILWGALVGMLNFVPYLGGLISCTILLMVGVVQYGLVSAAFLPPAVFLGINILESQFITPAVLGQSFRLNPLIIILWLAVMGWLWGVIGVLLAVPILVCIKIILEHLDVLPHWVKLLESEG
ncbi:AI-2E family transporter [Alteromonas ponticola]|uniref:AI-2E family transporter n=2 Tax=Alteromonas aquimaris TaxID=2998417 RepID=A0ABT3P9T3_9ALTE|nr:AI-2E family transporter [Alteromonas aquimaris]